MKNFIIALAAMAAVMSSCSKNSGLLDVEDMPTAPAEPTFYWPNEAGKMNVYDENGDVIVENVKFDGWTLEATKEQSYVASSGATGFPTIDIEAVEGNHKIGYTVAGKDASYEVKVGSLTREYNKKTLLPLHDLVLVVIKNVVSSETSPIFKEHVEVTTVLSWKKSDGTYVDYNSATTNIFVAEQIVPISVTAIGPNKVRINFNNNTSKEESAIFGLTAGGSYETEDDNGLVLANTEAEGKAKVASFSYATNNQSFSDNVAIEGTLKYDYTYNGVKYELQFTNDFVVVADWKVLLSEEEGFSFYQSSETNYTLVAIEDEKRVALASDKSNFVVWQKKSEPQPEPAKPEFWKQNNGKGIISFDDNTTASFENALGISAEQKKSFEGTKALSLSTSEKVAANSMSFANSYFDNQLTLTGNLGENVDYKEWKNIPCKSKFSVKAETHITTNGKEGYDFYNEGYILYSLMADDVKEAECKQYFEISKKTVVTVVGIEDNYEHIQLRPNANVSGSNITTICDNVATFTTLYSDGTSKEAGKVDYTVKHVFIAEGNLTFKVNNLNEVVGKSGNIGSDGSFQVVGNNIAIAQRSRNVSDIMFEGQNYKNNAPQCKVTPATWSIPSRDNMVITFTDEEGKSCTAELGIKVNVTTIIPYDVVSVVATDHFYAKSDINGKLYKYAGTAVHCRLADGRVFSFDIAKGASSGQLSSKTNVVGDYAWYEVAPETWELGLVTAEQVNQANTDYCLRYYHLNAMADGVINANDNNNWCALSLGNSEAVTSGTNYQNPIHDQIKIDSDGNFTVVIADHGYNKGVVGTYNFASK